MNDVAQAHLCVFLSNLIQRNWSDHLRVIAEEVSRVAELCIGQDMGTMSTATAFTEMVILTGNSFFCLIRLNVYAITD
jgi:hypothetical protein